MKRKMDGHLGQTSSSTNLSLRKYKLMRNIGHGAFSKVKLAWHLPTGCKVAIKILDCHKMEEQGMEEKVKREIKVCKLLMHPHIVRLYEVIETTNHIYMVMEYAQRGDLFDYVVENRRLEEQEARKFFQQIISGLEYCHRYRVVHRDLKPENVLLDSKCNLKIADFGLCNIMRDGHFLKTSCGSPNYAAPEVISNSLYSGPEVDVWSCGVILYVLLCGALPFDDVSLPNLYAKIKRGFYTLPSHLSPGARDLIALMLIVDPLKRISIPEIKQHYWFRVNLPNYLAAPFQDIMNHLNMIDREILQLVIEIGHDGNHLIQSLQNKIQNEATLSYYLLLDKKSAATSNSDPSSSYYEEPYSADMQIHNPPESSTQHNPPGFNTNQAIGSGFHLQSKRTWGIGLEFASHPHQIMVEVLSALQQLKVRWKKIGQYNMKCKWSQDHPQRINTNTGQSGLFLGNEVAECSNSASEKVVKFEVQLYKSHEEKYLLDVQRITGPQILFLDLCASFIGRLQVL